LSDNGGAYRAHETHSLARAMGLEPIHTPVCSPQSNGIDPLGFARDFMVAHLVGYISPVQFENLNCA
jgi:hypothetical protein